METREASEGIRVHTDPSNRLSSNNNPRPQNKSKEIPTSTLYSGQNEKFQTHCLHCAWTASLLCTKEIIRQKNHCFICLWPDHRSPDCTIINKCWNCNSSNHYQSTCDRNEKNEKQEPHSSRTTEQCTETPTEWSITTVFKEEGTVFLQTAQTVVSNVDWTKTKNVPSLFDNGSKHSYLTLT